MSARPVKHRYLWVFKPLTHLSDEKKQPVHTSSCLLGALASCYGAFGKNPRPNVILILADDMGIGDHTGT